MSASLFSLSSQLRQVLDSYSSNIVLAYSSVKSRVLDRITSTEIFTSGRTDQAESIHHRLVSQIPIKPSYVAPRNPIVLCHGLYGFDKLGPDFLPLLQVHYWKGIKEALEDLGAKVIITGVSRTGEIRRRAQEIHSCLEVAAAGDRVNFIAHSMGGLDCRYLITHLRPKKYKVQSLTTLCTPHRGSPFMDWCRDQFGVGFVSLGEVAQEVYPDRMKRKHNLLKYLSPTNAKYPAGFHPDLGWISFLLDEPAYANLTTDYCRKYFNPNTPDSPDVAYFSYGAQAKAIPWMSPLWLTQGVIMSHEGDNDGLVSLESARWGKYIETIEANHWDLNSRFRISTIGQTRFDAVDFFLRVATRLYHEGC
ncbi:alpha/beta-hydrolase [Basidiobolus meristosporus CBS 931.73]|uniref:Alpha/beta-hydrolase n=1 Tax=Basidiobolus meristosporus CBS 931.73 TaxID=1314790 RepID=A0A1Y1YE38_9FUNG|nr:alpha/beta-hydrolase [Basidiobolus meristosporus CBS 931.73]|eukprot:ORX95956.1 alpha/beta-hydrolase [Basidiobolus meristosporus CBS 931.73]